MWNPIKIWKLTKVLWSKGQTDLDLPKDELETGDVIIFASVGAGMNINTILYKY